jgi:hypothetical protein
MNLKSVLTVSIIFLFSVSTASAQGEYLIDSTIPVSHNGNTIKNPWTGGFNAPIFSEIDLNGDGIKDLFVFDKEGNRITTYINNGTANTVDYQLAPEYKKKFPQDLHDWVLLKDYNCDGREDIFTYSYAAGMTVYRNDYSTGTGLVFSVAYSLVNSKYGSVTANLYVASVNLPALVDVDYDGDLDVLTFPVSGNFVEYHVNKGMELFNKCDTLVYQIDPNCFGNFGLSGVSNTAILNVACRQSDPQPPVINKEEITNLHTGSCMIALDIDGDFDRDLINGDILGSNLLMLTNGGDSTSANMVNQDTAFPSYDLPLNMITFPSPYYIDVNNDGNKDLVVAPCITASAENFNNVWFYRNTTNNNTNVFNFQQNRFLSDEMIEVGSGANVSFTDVDSDGLMDLMVGNYGYFNSTGMYESGIAYYHNNGSAAAPSYELITIDYANLFSLPVTSVDPAFGDIDNDGDVDMILGNSDGTLIYYQNTAGQGNIPVYILAFGALQDNNGNIIDVGTYSSPQIVDVNADGKPDMLIGEKTGTINYYENTGTASSPQFGLSNSMFGGVNVTTGLSIYGYSNPCLYDSAGSWQLLVGSTSGYIYQYNHIDNNINGTFTLVDSMYYNIHEATRSTIDVADINNDGVKELIVGNYAGGVSMYKFQASSHLPESNHSSDNFKLFPNPVSDELYIKFNSPAGAARNIAVIDITGRIVESGTTFDNVVIMNAKKMAAGIYQCRVIEGSTVTTVKFVVYR